MAILNYGNQFKYSGKGYIDAKMLPVNGVEELETNVSILSSQYVPGMKVTVLNDGDFGAVDYFLNEDYEWKRVVNIESLTLSLDKGNFDGDAEDEALLQLFYTNAKGDLVALGEGVDLSSLLTDVEKRIEALENKEDVQVEDTNTYVIEANIVTEKEGEEGLFIEYVYNNGEKFYTNITELEPKVYSAGVGILIGEDNVISVDEEWFDAWFDGKTTELKTKLADLETAISEVNGKVTTLSDNLNAISGRVTNNEEAIVSLNSNLTAALAQISENKIEIENVKVTANDAVTKANDNATQIVTLSEQLAKIRGVEYIKAGENVNVEVDEDGFVKISSVATSVDTTDIENRLEAAEGKIEGHTSDIASLQEAVKNLTPDGEGLSGDNVTIKTNEAGSLSVMISADENNMLQSKANGLFVQGIEVVLGDDEINAEE